MPDIAIFETSPAAVRDASKKLALLAALSNAGANFLEAGDAAEEAILRLEEEGLKAEGAAYCAYAQDETALAAALAHGVTEIVVCAPASEEYALKHGGAPIPQRLARLELLIEAARNNYVQVRGVVSCAFGCPVSGAVPAAQTAAIAEGLARLGCAEVALADISQTAEAAAAKEVLRAVAARIPLQIVACRFASAQAALLDAALEAGVMNYDCGLSGLGRVCLLDGASSKIASTQAAAAHFEARGLATGFDLEKLDAAAALLG